MVLDFEQPIRDIEKKIQDIEQYMKASDVDLTHEVELLKAKKENLFKSIYADLSLGKECRLHVQVKDRQL